MKPSFFKNTTDKLSNTRDAVLNQMKEGLSKVGDFGKNNTDKFLNYVKEVFDLLPVLEKVGFKATSLEIGISLPPAIDIQFVRVREASEEEIASLFEEYDDNRTLKLILRSLVTASSFQQKLSPESFVFTAIGLTVSIPPRVSIRYVRKDMFDVDTIRVEL